MEEPLHAMLDLETLSLKPNAVIVQVGVAYFTAEGIVSTRQIFPGLQWQIDAGRHVDAHTLAWWMQQEEPVRSLINGAGSSRDEVEMFFADMQLQDLAGVWGNGSDFDNAVIIDLCRQMRWPLPWSYKSNRCFRTIRSMKGVDELDVPFNGTPHNALDDAKHQAERLIHINNAFGGILL